MPRSVWRGPSEGAEGWARVKQRQRQRQGHADHTLISGFNPQSNRKSNSVLSRETIEDHHPGHCIEKD